MSKLGATALAVALGYLIFKVLVGFGYLLYLICKMAVLLPVAILALCAGNVQIRRGPLPTTALPAALPAALPDPGKPAPAPELGPASIPSTGDWRQDRETLKQLLAEGKIK